MDKHLQHAAYLLSTTLACGLQTRTEWLGAACEKAARLMRTKPAIVTAILSLPTAKLASVHKFRNSHDSRLELVQRSSELHSLQWNHEHRLPATNDQLWKGMGSIQRLSPRVGVQVATPRTRPSNKDHLETRLKRRPPLRILDCILSRLGPQTTKLGSLHPKNCSVVPHLLMQRCHVQTRWRHWPTLCRPVRLPAGPDPETPHPMTMKMGYSQSNSPDLRNVKARGQRAMLANQYQPDAWRRSQHTRDSKLNLEVRTSLRGSP